MLSIEISQKEINTPGLFIMRWQKRTGLARVVGTPKSGFKLIQPDNASEAYLTGLPKDGIIPADALFSEPLAVVVV